MEEISLVIYRALGGSSLDKQPQSELTVLAHKIENLLVPLHNEIQTHSELNLQQNCLFQCNICHMQLSEIS